MESPGRHLCGKRVNQASPSHSCPCYPYELHFDTSRWTDAQVCRLSAVFRFCCCFLSPAKFIEYAFRRQVLVGACEISGRRRSLLLLLVTAEEKGLLGSK